VRLAACEYQVFLVVVTLCVHYSHFFCSQNGEADRYSGHGEAKKSTDFGLLDDDVAYNE
jgi:hypothetical protein